MIFYNSTGSKWHTPDHDAPLLHDKKLLEFFAMVIFQAAGLRTIMTGCSGDTLELQFSKLPSFNADDYTKFRTPSLVSGLNAGQAKTGVRKISLNLQ